VHVTIIPQLICLRALYVSAKRSTSVWSELRLFVCFFSIRVVYKFCYLNTWYFTSTHRLVSVSRRTYLMPFTSWSTRDATPPQRLGTLHIGNQYRWFTDESVASKKIGAWEKGWRGGASWFRPVGDLSHIVLPLRGHDSSSGDRRRRAGASARFVPAFIGRRPAQRRSARLTDIRDGGSKVERPVTQEFSTAPSCCIDDRALYYKRCSKQLSARLGWARFAFSVNAPATPVWPYQTVCAR